MGNLGVYEQLTTEAKKVGGPEQLIKNLINYGEKRGRKKMIPSLVCLSTIIVGLGLIASEQYIEKKDLEKQIVILKAKKIFEGSNSKNNEIISAEVKAREYLRKQPFSITALIEQLEKDGFSNEQANQGVLSIIAKDINGTRQMAGQM